MIMNNEELVLLIQQGENIKKNMQKLYDQNYYLLRKTAKKYSNIDSMTDIDDLMQDKSYIYLCMKSRSATRQIMEQPLLLMP